MKIVFYILTVFVYLGCSVSQKRLDISKFNNDSVKTLNKKFGPAITEFELTVPADYNHYTQLDSFVRQHHEEWDIKWWISDKNFVNSSNKLLAGKSYDVKIFPILTKVTYDDCLEFIKNEKTIFVNAQGLTLAWSLHGNKFPKDRWILSLDDVESLPKSPDVKYIEYNIPMIGPRDGPGLDGVWQLNLYSINSGSGWDTN